MNFVSSWLYCLSCFGKDSDTNTLSSVPLMSKPPPKRPTSKYKFKSRKSFIRNERTYSFVAGQVNPFVSPVQCTVSARAPYPSRRDLISINSFVDYDTDFSLVNRNASLKNLHLKFRQGDGICVLGQFGGMLVGYLEKDSSRTIGFFSPDLVYVDLGSINQIELPSELISEPASAYTRCTMSSLPDST